ncbi:unnamed protein product, partial [Iphiclides podalirius]
MDSSAAQFHGRVGAKTRVLESNRTSKGRRFRHNSISLARYPRHYAYKMRLSRTPALGERTKGGVVPSYCRTPLVVQPKKYFEYTDGSPSRVQWGALRSA